MNDSNYIEFENYISNELSSEEKKHFEEKLNTNADLKEEFEIYKALNTSLSSKFSNEEEEQNLRKTLTKLGNKHIAKKGKVIELKTYKNLMIAASIAIIVGLFVFNNNTPSYNDYANHNALELVVRGENNEAFSRAEEAFNSKNYEEALKELTFLSNIYLTDTEIQLYKGICLLELGNYYEAEAIFDKISAGTSSLSSTAVWYKALSLLKQKKYIACKQLLKTIPQSAPEYNKAQDLLDKL
ncbi:tetratricopeptide repeat protein [Lutibacter sp.]